MIKSFRIKNFRSVKEEQVLDLTAANNNKEIHTNNAVQPEGRKFSILKSVGVFGANASGKSNILLAFKAIEYMVTESSDWKLDAEIRCYEPFKLDEKTRNAPCIFEIEFIGEGNLLYLYKIEFTRYSFIHESLSFYPTTQKANLFSRNIDENGKQSISFGSRLKGKVKTIPCLKNNLYLSKAANTEGASEILKTIYRYFRNKLAIIDQNIMLGTNMLLKDTKQREALTALLACADTGITGIELKEKNIDTDKLHFPGSLSDDMKNHIIEDNKYQPVFFHHGKKEYEFSLHEESRGTQRLLELSPLLLVGLKRGDIIVIDEIDSSLHPHISELLINLFHDPQVNKNNAQLIFSSHDITLMNQEFMRRDQVVLTEKDEFGATGLFSLDEINGVRKDSPYSKWYLSGRMGAVPQIAISRIKQLLISEI